MELRSVPDTSAASTTATLDPGEAIFAEVERGMAGMIEQHTAWLELCASGLRGEEYDWRTAELLSCLRSIEWDLQDLEDHVSIVEGAPTKFSDVSDETLKSRKELIDGVRAKIDVVRENVQEAQSSEGGHAAARAKATTALKNMAKGFGKGFVKLKEENAPLQPSSSSNGGGTGLGSNGSNGGGAASEPALGMPKGLAAREAAEKSKPKPWYLCCC